VLESTNESGALPHQSPYRDDDDDDDDGEYRGLQSVKTGKSMETVVSDVADVIVGDVQSLQGVEADKHVVCDGRQLVMTQVTATASITSTRLRQHSRPMTSGLEMEWDYSGRLERYGKTRK